MKKILITGAGSYIGNSFARYLQQFPGQYHTEVVDMIVEAGGKSAFLAMMRCIM